ncbi:ATP-binding cassette domain-containing protein, partial [Pseudoalteromonas sp. SIMBA_153]
YEGLVRELKGLREERSDRREQVGNVNITMRQGEKSGKLVCKVKNLHLEYDGNVLVDDFTTTIMRGDKIGIVGPNGAGKTTLYFARVGTLIPTVVDPHSGQPELKNSAIRVMPVPMKTYGKILVHPD